MAIIQIRQLTNRPANWLNGCLKAAFKLTNIWVGKYKMAEGEGDGVTGRDNGRASGGKRKRAMANCGLMYSAQWVRALRSGRVAKWPFHWARPRTKAFNFKLQWRESKSQASGPGSGGARGREGGRGRGRRQGRRVSDCSSKQKK